MSGSNAGGIDASIPLQAGKGVAPLNPFGQLGDLARTVGAVNQLKLFPGQLQQQQQQIQSNAGDLATQGQRLFAQRMIPFLARSQGASPQDLLAGVTGIGADIERNHGIPMHGMVSDIARIPIDGNTYDAYGQLARGYAATPGNEAAAAAPGVYGTQDLGNRYQPTITGQPLSTTAGQTAPNGPGMATSISPAGLAQPYSYKDENGKPAYTTVGKYALDHGIDPRTLLPTAPVQMTPGGTAPAPQQIPSGGQGGGATNRGRVVGPDGQPVGPNNPARLAIPSGGAAPMAPSGGLRETKGPAPGVEESQREQVGPAQNVADRVAQFPADSYPLVQTLSALNNAPTGKKSTAIYDASAFISRFAPDIVRKGLDFVAPLMTPAEQTAFEEARKYMTQVQLGAPGATRSNEGQSAAGAATPSVEISKEAAQVLTKGLLGLRRMEQDQGQSWLAASAPTTPGGPPGKPPGDFNQFRGQFAKNADPSVYLWDQMSPAERQAKLASIKGSNPAETLAKQTAFKASVQRADNNGVFGQ